MRRLSLILALLLSTAALPAAAAEDPPQTLESLGPVFADWQKDFVLSVLAEPGRRASLGVSSKAWAGLDALGREKVVIGLLIEETNRRLSKEVNDLAWSPAAWGAPSQRSRQDSVIFAQKVLTFEQRYPLARPDADAAGRMEGLRRRAAFLQSEDYYRHTHPGEAGMAALLGTTRLESLFDGSGARPAPSPASPEAMILRFEGGPAPAEGFKTLLAGMKTSTERRVFGAVAEGQMAFSHQRGSGLSPEILVSTADLGPFLRAQVWWDNQAGKDGKKRIRLEINETVLTKEGPGSPGMRTTLAHELTHIADFLAKTRPSERYIEPRAFLNGARTARDMGLPRESRGTGDYLGFCGDPVAWMHGQLTDYARFGQSLWGNMTVDDLDDPESGLDRRLQFSYHYVTRLGTAETNDKEAARAALAKDVGLPAELLTLLLAVAEDRKLSEWDKPFIFAGRARATDFAKAWLMVVSSVRDNQGARIRRDHANFWVDLGRFHQGDPGTQARGQ